MMTEKPNKKEEYELASSKGQLLVYLSDDGQVKLDVRLEGETVWLTQQLIAELFQTTVPNVSMHIRNVYEEGELTPEATVQKFLTVRQGLEKNKITPLASNLWQPLIFS